ncbi:MAG: HNH endonuclease [Chloroflexi bacterium]|nr:HNH endonuclease [Chloroflexota bacterium]
MGKRKRHSLSDLVFAFFEARPYAELAHDDWIDEITRQYEELVGRTPRDPWRAARKLHEEGKLQKVKNGVYKYDPSLHYEGELEEFTEQQRQAIFSRDNYKCVACGKTRASGAVLHVDHIRAKAHGGRAIIDNGQTLCSICNYMKKNRNATETYKQAFIRLYEMALNDEQFEVVAFCRDILKVYKVHDINGHIEWNP